MWVFKADKNANIAKIVIFGMVSLKDSMNFCTISCEMVETPENYCVYLCISRPFMTKKSAKKITLDLYTSHTQIPEPSNPRHKHNNCLKPVRKLRLFIEHNGEPQLGNQANLHFLCLLQFARFMGWCDIFFDPIGSCN